MKQALTSIGNFFKKIGLWCKNHAPTRRRIIQLYAALLTNANIKGLFSGLIYTGSTKNACVPGLNCYSCPSTVGACPLGALQNALAGSNTKTPVYIIGILALFGMMLGRTICGFLCPTGLLQDLLYKIKTPKLKKNRITRILSYLKYVILVVLVIAVPLAFMLQSVPVPGFCKYICPSGTLGGAILLLLNPLNADMFPMLGGLFTWKFAVLVIILLASVFMYRPFCRFLCPLGAIYGFFNKLALLGVKVEKDKCVDCGLCVAHCKMDIRKVGDHECINCGECIAVCPTKAIVWKGSSIFIKANDTESELAVKVPLTNFVKPLPASQTAPVQEISADMADMMAIEGTPSSPAAATPAAAAALPMRRIPRPRIGAKGRKALEITACATAAALLTGAIVYYNFFDAEAAVRVTEINRVGDLCTTFTIETIGEENPTYSVEDTRGKVTVLNFWGTWCGPCVKELPYFSAIADSYPDSVAVVAIHSVIREANKDIEQFIDDEGWSDNIIFAQDSVQSTGNNVYTDMGGNASYPITIILDAQGKITNKVMGSVTYDELLQMITALL